MSNNANQQNAAMALEALRMGVEFELLIKYDGPLKSTDGKTPWKQKAYEYYTAFQKDVAASPDKKTATEAAFRRKMAGSSDMPDEWQWKCSDIAVFIKEKWDSSKNKRMIPLDMVNCLAPFSNKPPAGSPDPRTRDVDPDYTKWSITRDYAITCPLDRYGDLFGFEIIGPVMDLSSKDRNTQAYAVCAFYELFNFLTGKDEFSCGLEIYASSISTSTHFHVSPPKTIQWNVDQVRRIMCSAYYWDPCVRYLLPAWRRLREYAPDSRTYPKSAQLYPKPDDPFKVPQFIAGRFPRSIWDDPAQEPPYLRCTKEDIRCNLKYLNELKDFDALYKHQRVKEGSKVGWNLANLVLGHDGKVGGVPLGTVEFRRPPASMSWFEAICWLDLTYAMVRAACDRGTPDELMRSWPPKMETFQEWLKPYRLISTLEVYPALDSKFTRAIAQSDQLRLYLTDAEETVLDQARKDFGKQSIFATTTSSMSMDQVQEAAAETFSKCAQELIDSRGIEVNNTLAHPKEQLDTILKSIKSRLQAEMTKPEILIF